MRSRLMDISEHFGSALEPASHGIVSGLECRYPSFNRRETVVRIRLAVGWEPVDQHIDFSRLKADDFKIETRLLREHLELISQEPFIP